MQSLWPTSIANAFCCQVCGAYGAAGGLKRLRRRGGLLFMDCKGSRAQGTREQRRRMAQGRLERKAGARNLSEGQQKEGQKQEG